eukprot:evm.model.scf_9.14 EVM.evm.TU.scf_9.14   scf_9:197702-199945(-)
MAISALWVVFEFSQNHAKPHAALTAAISDPWTRRPMAFSVHLRQKSTTTLTDPLTCKCPVAPHDAQDPSPARWGHAPSITLVIHSVFFPTVLGFSTVLLISGEIELIGQLCLAGLVLVSLCTLCAAGCDDQYDISGTYDVDGWLPASAYSDGAPPSDHGSSTITRKPSLPCNIYEGTTTWQIFGSINFVGALAPDSGEYAGGWSCDNCQILPPGTWGYFNFTYNSDGTMSGSTGVYGAGPEVTSYQEGKKGSQQETDVSNV